MEPEKVGRYEILDELGRGAMGRVLLAHDPQIDRRVAIKLIQSFGGVAPSDRAESRDRFLREARAAGRLLHPGIVTLFDAGETDSGDLYLAMEYVQGITLDRYCKPSMLLDVATAAELVAAAAEALHFAHDAGIVHRDVKPANLMRVGEAGVKVMDFGLARGFETNLTRDGALLGTPSYMSPEQIRDLPLDGRSDLFSLALVLFELLTGEKAFPGDTISSIIYRIVHEEPREATDVHGRVPVELSAFLRRALAKDPGARFRDGHAFAAALRSAAAALPHPEPSRAATPTENEPPLVDREHPATERTAPHGSSALPFVLAIVVVLAAAGAGLWTFRDRLGLFQPPAEEPRFVETTVRTQPVEGVTVTLDGEPIDPAAAGTIRFPAEGPYGVVRATAGCREVTHELGPADAGQVVELVLDPVDLEVPLTDPEGAEVRLNGERLGRTPLELSLDLCRDNAITVVADGFQPAELALPTGVSRIDARKALAEIELAPIPKGTLTFPDSRLALSYTVDGRRIDRGTRSVELPAGEHRLRAVNDRYWIDVTGTVEVVAGESVAADLPVPALTRLRVQAFPANCKVDLRRPGGRWRYLDDTPAQAEVAVGAYQVRVTLKPTGESKILDVRLKSGSNPDVRVSFGG